MSKNNLATAQRNLANAIAKATEEAKAKGTATPEQIAQAEQLSSKLNTASIEADAKAKTPKQAENIAKAQENLAKEIQKATDEAIKKGTATPEQIEQAKKLAEQLNKEAERAKTVAEKAVEIRSEGNLIFQNPSTLKLRDRIRRKNKFRPAIIFKPILRARLKKKNVALRDDKDVVELAYKFKKYILDKQPYNRNEDRFLNQNFEEVANEYTPETVFNLVDDAVKVAKDFTPIIKQIIDGIIKFFKKIRERKAEGKATPEELQELAEIDSPLNKERAQEEIDADKEEEKSAMLKELFNWKTLAFIVGGGILIYFAFIRKK